MKLNITQLGKFQPLIQIENPDLIVSLTPLLPMLLQEKKFKLTVSHLNLKNTDQPHSSRTTRQVASSGNLLIRDRTKRQIKPNSRYAYFADHLFYALVTFQDLVNNEPKTFKEDMSSRQSKEWKLAMMEEIQSLHINMTWILVDHPLNKHVVDCKWIFKVKQ